MIFQTVKIMPVEVGMGLHHLAYENTPITWPLLHSLMSCLKAPISLPVEICNCFLCSSFRRF